MCRCQQFLFVRPVFDDRRKHLFGLVVTMPVFAVAIGSKESVESPIYEMARITDAQSVLIGLPRGKVGLLNQIVPQVSPAQLILYAGGGGAKLGEAYLAQRV